MEIVYVESSVISYITARPSRDVVVSARQALSIEWWEYKREQYEVYIPELVIEEITSGNPSAAQKGLDIVKTIISLELTLEAKELASLLLSEGAVPENSPEDALHIGLAAAQGFVGPILCSPDEL